MEGENFLERYSNHIAVYVACIIVAIFFFGSYGYWATRYLISPENTQQAVNNVISPGGGTLAQDVGTVINGVTTKTIITPGKTTVTGGGTVTTGSSSNGNNTGTILDKRLVWAHNIPSTSLTFSGVDAYPNTYGATYPLILSSQDSTSAFRSVVKEAEYQGIDGFNVDILARSYVAGALTSYLTAADPDAGKFYIAPNLDMSGLSVKNTDGSTNYPAYIDNVEYVINTYCSSLGPKHPSAAKIGNKWAIFIYGSKGLSPSQWQQVRDSATASGCGLYFVGDVSTDFNSNYSATTITSNISYSFPAYDAGYIFGSAPFSSNYYVNGGSGNTFAGTTAWETIVNYFNTNKKLFFGGMWPGYYRGYGVSNGFGTDNDNTNLYSREWQRQISTNVPWVVLTTWNDFTEHTMIEPTSEWNQTQADLTAWYTDQYKGAALPYGDARLYITTPESLWLNQNGNAEALALNPTDQDVTASLSIIDSNNTVISGTSTITVKAKSLGRITLNMAQPSVPSGHYLRAKASLSTGPSVTSAPTLFYPTARPAGNDAPVVYYSVPASQALSNQPQLTISNGTATVTLPAGTSTFKFVDVLHDTKLVKSFRPGTNPLSTMLSAQPADGYYHSDDEYGLTSDFYLYVARVIDTNNNVSYSSPVYIGP